MSDEVARSSCLDHGSHLRHIPHLGVDDMTAADDQRAAAVVERALIEMSAGAHNMFRLYGAYITAGFTPDQAMAVIITFVKHGLESNS